MTQGSPRLLRRDLSPDLVALVPVQVDTQIVPTPAQNAASTWGNRGSESPHRSDSVGAGMEPTAALPIVMVPRGYRAIACARVLETGGQRWLSMWVWTCR